MELTSSNPFFDHPILNSPYDCPQRHWELDADGQPTQQGVVAEFGKNRTLSQVVTLEQLRAGADGCQADVCPNWTSGQRGKTVRVGLFSAFLDTTDARSIALT